MYGHQQEAEQEEGDKKESAVAVRGDREDDGGKQHAANDMHLENVPDDAGTGTQPQ